MAIPTEEQIAPHSERIGRLLTALDGVLFGQEALLKLVVTGLLARGHLLLEGLPGLGKTQLVKGLSRALSLETKRIQFTPDLLPGDITGNPILQESGGRRQFVFQPGPLFCHLCLADEINRASPKTQSALLEAMQERRVTVLGEAHPIPDPFFVLATQNPIELEGTYPLPEAQLDRFLFKLDVPRTGLATLQRIVEQREIGVEPEVDPVLMPEEFGAALQMTRQIYLPEAVANYIARLVDGTHPGQSNGSSSVKFGASPRAALSLASAAKAQALIAGRIHAGFEDVKAVAQPVLGHRIILDYDARIRGLTPAGVIASLLEEIPFQDLALPKSLKSVL